jgi:hypothetical protein
MFDSTARRRAQRNVNGGIIEAVAQTGLGALSLSK